MPLPVPKLGPYTLQELLALWQNVVDPLYAQPLIERGEGFGLEVFTQQMAQLERVSLAIDRTLQAMFILPWSGQTDQPGRGGAQATVELTFERTARFATAITLAAGDVFYEEETTDYADVVGIEVQTGRRYALLAPATFLPGERGPLLEDAFAEKQGDGYNNPFPGTIKQFVQPGSGLSNVRASVVPGPTTHRLVLAVQPDVLTPQHLGQYVELLAGANAGQVRRVVAYERPDPTAPHGGVGVLAKTGVLQVSPIIGTFQPGEEVSIGAGPTPALLVAVGGVSGDRMVIENVDGPILVLDAVIGVLSGAFTTITVIDQSPELVTEAGTAAWKVLDWEVDFGLSVTNVLSPAGGLAPMLDELGSERGIGRAPGEGDDLYRERIAKLPDVVSPNAVRRTGNRLLAPIGATVCLREVGEVDRLFPGFFLDVSEPAPQYGYAFDLDLVTLVGFIGGQFVASDRVTALGGATGRASFTYPAPAGPLPADMPVPVFDGVVAPEGVFAVGDPAFGSNSGAVIVPAIVGPGLKFSDRFKLVMDYTEFRAFFLLGAPPLGLGEFGYPYDTPAGGLINAYDSSPFLTFYDGFPVTAAVIYRSLWQAVDKVRAGGVGFDLYVEAIGCV